LRRSVETWQIIVSVVDDILRQESLAVARKNALQLIQFLLQY